MKMEMDFSNFSVKFSVNFSVKFSVNFSVEFSVNFSVKFSVNFSVNFCWLIYSRGGGGLEASKLRMKCSI